jgi:tetratricopeptide (TPR) repeat protein
MKMFRFKYYTWLIAILALASVSCNKQNEFLNALPSESLAVPNTLSDLQLLIQDDNLFNRFDPYYMHVSCDDYYVTNSLFNSNSNRVENNLYIWANNIYISQTTPVDDWNAPYEQVYTANIVLESIAKINPTTTQATQYNTVKGSALFFRAKAFYNLLQEFAVPYNASGGNSDLGIPLRLSSDINLKCPRSSVQASYDQVISDFQSALTLLPSSSANVALPNTLSTNGFLARVYLSMGNYAEALKYSNAYLTKQNSLTDYNTLQIGAYPISNNVLVEDVFHSTAINGGLNSSGSALIDSNLYNSYDNNDLRKSIFFWSNEGFWSWNGTYDVIHANDIFNGIATDEIYLIRAECNARAGNVADAMNDLNALLAKRYITNTFVTRTATDATDALQQILVERRKELIYRGLRWTDLRRLNQTPATAVTLTRIINGNTYTLKPNDPRYTLPIPPQEIQLNPIPQNPR